MNVTFGDIQFDRVHFDRDADVLYLGVEGDEPVHWEESPEGHVLQFDQDGNLCGLTLVGLSHHRDADGHVFVTVPRREELELPGLDLITA